MKHNILNDLFGILMNYKHCSTQNAFDGLTKKRHSQIPMWNTYIPLKKRLSSKI